MAHKSNATMLWPKRRNQPVPEFFAVDEAFRALLLCAVKGGVSCHQTSYLRFSRFNLSLFLRLHFFITHLTLPVISIYFLPITHHQNTVATTQRRVATAEINKFLLCKIVFHITDYLIKACNYGQITR